MKPRVLVPRAVAAAAILSAAALAQAAEVEKYYHLDAVGSIRAITDRNGTVLERFDYHPYGEDASPPTTTNTRRFAGKQRDPETATIGGLDYFGARYYHGRLARFTSVDPNLDSGAALVDPQRWNRYAYGRNNPLRYVDPNGRDAAEVIQFGRQLEGSGIPWVVPVGITVVLVAQYGPEIAQGAKTAVDAIAESGAFSGAQPTYPGVDIGLDQKMAGISFNKKQGSGPKAGDAPGTTASGQATDEYGNKLGPSGKPVVHETESTTREGARNKALNEGSGAVEHPSPKQGQPHFHPTDAKGEKKPSSTHHNYPE